MCPWELQGRRDHQGRRLSSDLGGIRWESRGPGHSGATGNKVTPRTWPAARLLLGAAGQAICPHVT